MKALFAALLAVLAGAALAADPPSCAVPDYFLSGDNSLKRVSAAVVKLHRLTIAVFGTGSSTLAGADGPSIAYPSRLNVALNQKLSKVDVKVVSQTRNGQTADAMRRGMKDLLGAEQPNLVIWQTGTVDAIRRVELDEFRAALEAGVDTLQAGGADVILMNMQYSPRTESMIQVGPYADDMRAVAQQREVPLFDRFAIMRYWADEGAFDFYAAGRDTGLAQRVHDCMGRAIGRLVIATGHLQSFENKTTP
jgi:ABC-type amino acid transport substrate-binding protein